MYFCSRNLKELFIWFVVMEVDILFLMPSTKPFLKDESIGTLILAKKAILAGYNVEILRYWEVLQELSDYESFSIKMIDSVLKKNPKILSFYCRCSEYHICLDIAGKIKNINPSIKILFAGPQAEIVAQKTLEYFSFVDYICCSEGENTIVPLLNSLIRNIEFKCNIPGLTYRNNGIIVQNTFPDLLPNNYVQEFNYYDLIPKQVILNSESTSIDVGRGCPFTCTFCSTKKFWKQMYRLRSIDDIIREITEIFSLYGIRRYCLDHDLFTANHRNIKTFCQKLKEMSFTVEWYCSSRIDTISEELIDVMKEAGCYKILYGIESGSPKIQKMVNKNLNLDKCEKIIKYTLSKGISVIASFMYGFPEETEDDFEQTFEMMQKIQEIGAKTIAWRCGILNGTEMFEKYNHLLYISDYNLSNSLFFGFDELCPMIKEYKVIFPHFCDFMSPLRTELIYLELFRSIWNYFLPNVYVELSSYFTSKRWPLLEMYRTFVKVNEKYLSNIRQKPEEPFWGASIEDCKLLTIRFQNFVKNNMGKF